MTRCHATMYIYDLSNLTEQHRPVITSLARESISPRLSSLFLNIFSETRTDGREIRPKFSVHTRQATAALLLCVPSPEHLS